MSSLTGWRNMSVLRSRVEDAERHGVPVLVVPVAELRKLYEIVDKFDEILRMTWEGEEIDWD